MDPPKEPSDTNANDDDDTAIILNPTGPEHDGPIPGVTTDQYQTVVDTDTAGETPDTKPTGVADLTGATDHLGVSMCPTKEDSEQEDEDDANMTERCQKEKDS